MLGPAQTSVLTKTKHVHKQTLSLLMVMATKFNTIVVQSSLS